VNNRPLVDTMKLRFRSGVYIMGVRIDDLLLACFILACILLSYITEPSASPRHGEREIGVRGKEEKERWTGGISGVLGRYEFSERNIYDGGRVLRYCTIESIH